MAVDFSQIGRYGPNPLEMAMQGLQSGMNTGILRQNAQTAQQRLLLDREKQEGVERRADEEHDIQMSIFQAEMAAAEQAQQDAIAQKNAWANAVINPSPDNIANLFAVDPTGKLRDQFVKSSSILQDERYAPLMARMNGLYVSLMNNPNPNYKLGLKKIEDEIKAAEAAGAEPKVIEGLKQAAEGFKMTIKNREIGRRTGNAALANDNSAAVALALPLAAIKGPEVFKKETQDIQTAFNAAKKERLDLAKTKAEVGKINAEANKLRAETKEALADLESVTVRNSDGVPLNTESMVKKRQDTIRQLATSYNDYMKKYDGYGMAFSKFYSLADDSIKNENPAAGHSLIFVFNKILDPNSVVRESEFQKTAQIGGILSQLETWRNKYKDGQFPVRIVKKMKQAVQTIERAILKYKAQESRKIRNQNKVSLRSYYEPGSVQLLQDLDAIEGKFSADGTIKSNSSLADKYLKKSK